ncbi:MAG: hypothetical protein RIQ54_34 [Candidatus Parcubacteria bacterium]|jgi:23S rRNA pseudouridine1911/1915/1917 synthase
MSQLLPSVSVLFEDNHVIAVFKPAGVPVAPDDSGDPSLLDMVKMYLKQTYKKPGNVFLGLVHRLDRPVSGIVVFAKTSKGASRLSEQFRARTVSKIYHALVIGRPSNDRGVLRNFLKKNQHHSVRRAVVDDRDGDLAELSYAVVSTNGKFSVVAIQLHTGKFHQIRVQLSAIGCPIVGDVKYGAYEPLPDASICLIANELTFLAATTQEKIVVRVPVPPEWIAQTR